MEIQFQDVHFQYSKTTHEVFHSITWTSSIPEVIGLLGVNGSGKSTFIRLLGGLIKPTLGKVFIDGKALTGIPSIKEHLCFVPENARLFLVGPTLRKEIHRLKIDKKDSISLLEDSGLIHLIDEKLYILSEGQRRLLAIWLAFQLKRQIILLDEPTIGMDIQGKRLFSMLLNEAKAHGKTVIIASNDSRILPMLDRISVIEKKQILLDGSPMDVLYRLENTTKLIPNQVVRLISSINRLGGSIPHYTDISQLNSYLQQFKGRDV